MELNTDLTGKVAVVTGASGTLLPTQGVCSYFSTTKILRHSSGDFLFGGGTGLEQFLPGYRQKTNKGRVPP